jgi:glycosyltransferase involved in cell wall biosynthesis
MRRLAPRTVVRIIDRLNVGGPAIHAVLTARGLDPSRYRTVLVLGSVEPGEADMGYLLDGANVEHVVIPSLGRELRPLADLYTAWRLYRLVRAIKPDVVHTHKAKAGALGRMVALLCRVPVRVHTYHGHVFHGYFGATKTRVFLAVERALAPYTSRLVALSDELADELAGRYRLSPRARFTVVPLGLELGPFTAAARHAGALRARLGAAPDAPLIGIVGRMVPVKDHRSFVAAAQRLLERRPTARFVFIGGGELEPAVRAQAEGCGILPHCHFLGWQRELAPLYADLDALALSSVNEGTPVALIEAMAAGVPVAATAVGGVPDLLGHGARGELAPPRDPTALAQAIDRALAPEAQARAARIRAEVAAEHGAARLCDDLARLYDELLDHQ